MYRLGRKQKKGNGREKTSTVRVRDSKKKNSGEFPWSLFFSFFFSFVFSRSNRYRPSRYWRSRQGNRKSDSLLAFSIAYAKLNGLAESGPRGQHTRLRKDRARRRSMPTTLLEIQILENFTSTFSF